MEYLQLFRKQTKYRTFEKYFYMLFYSAVILLGLFIFYDFIVHYSKYDSLQSRIQVILFLLFIFTLGILGIVFTIKRFKIFKIQALLECTQKRIIVNTVLSKFGNLVWENSHTICYCIYRKNWWNPDYKICLGFDDTTFYLFVNSMSRNFGAGIDTGELAGIQKRLTNDLYEFVNSK